MEALFLRVTVLSLTGSAVLLPLLLLSGRIHHRYAAKTCYFLWLLLALRLLLPFQFPLPQPAVTVETPVYPVSLPASAVTADTHMTGPGAGRERPVTRRLRSPSRRRGARSGRSP